MEQLKQILKGKFPSIDFDSEKTLVSSGIIDSLDVVGIIAELEDAFGIDVTMEYIQPEYFESVDAIWNMIQELA